MGAGLRDPLAHNSWATRELLAFCSDLKPEQLGATSEGTYGTILATLQHIIGAESRYRFRLSGAEVDWAATPEDTDDLDGLSRMADDMASYWEALAAGGFDPDRIISGAERSDPKKRFEVKAGVLVAQVLNHGNEHRAQIYTILTTLGLEPPELDGWNYGMATGGFRYLTSET